MCLTPKIPNTGDESRRLEEERQAKVRQNVADINTQFDTKFGPDYYGQVGQAFSNYYQPQVDKQFQNARRQTAFRFAANPNSSAANRAGGELQGAYDAARANVASGSYDAVNKAKSEVEANRSKLLGLAEAGTSQDSLAAQTQNAIGQEYKPGAYSPIGDVFSSYLGNLGSTAQRSSEGYATNPFYQRQVDFLRGNKAGSSRVIGG